MNHKKNKHYQQTHQRIKDTLLKLIHEKKKVNTIYTALTTRNVDENNYKKAVEWIIKIIEEG